MTATAVNSARRPRPRSGAGPWLAAAAGLATLALYVYEETKIAAREHPPTGKFITVDGVRLHYIDTGGADPALILLHGNGAMIADMEISGLVEEAAKRYRVIAFDRPGYGHSERPRGRVWDARAQADLFSRAFAKLGFERPLVFGHSWGAQLALALGLDHPDSVGGLVVASGYYYPTLRSDALMALPSSVPVLGDLLRHTISPLIARATARAALAKMFAPQAVTPRFEAEFPLELTLRPSQMRASAEETELMVTGAAALQGRYSSLIPPSCILAGAADRIVDTDSQALRLHAAIAQSELRKLPGLGHMLHHFATEEVVRAIDAVAERATSDAAPA